MLRLTELLELRGFAANHRRTKLVRHKQTDSTVDLSLLWRQGLLETYQQFQARPVFNRCDCIVSFVGEDARQGRLFGIFEVAGLGSLQKELSRTRAAIPGSPAWTKTATVCYRLRRLGGYEDLEDRLVIDWGATSLRQWHQWLQPAGRKPGKDKEVVQLLPPGRRLEPFRNYLEISLTHRELVELATNEVAHDDWRSSLRAVGGVYLIVASHTGQQYVGSATGTGGVWQRWCNYARTGHGANAELRKLVAQGDGYPAGFVYSILQTFSSATTREEALRLEVLFKRKLGRGVLSLNAN